MEISLANVTEDIPKPIPDLTVSSQSNLASDIARAPPVMPPTINNIRVTPAPMPQVTAAGVRLAQIVLGIMTGTIFILFVYLGTMDFRVGSDVSAIYDKIINPNRIGTEVYALSELDRMITDLSALTNAEAQPLSATAQANIDNVITLVDRLHSISLDEKNLIKNCHNIPDNASKNEFVKRCIDAIEGIRQAPIEASSGISDAQTAAEYAGKVSDARASLHSFWIQSAQLILLNLLLPLLTALFGYVFGTQQSLRPQPDSRE